MKPSAPLALIATGHLSAAPFTVPIWVKLLCATAMALATLSGGWRIINTMGNRITTVESPQGFAAESSSAATILASSYYGYPLSTTQIVSGGVMGAGLGKRGGIVHWPVVGQMATPWVITLPSAALVAFAMWRISDLFGTNTNAGAIVITLLAAAIAFGLYVLSKRNAITARGSRPHERDTGARGATGSPSDPCIRLTIMFVVASPIVDWSAIWKICLVTLAAGAGIVVIFGFLLLGLKLANTTTTTDGTQASGSRLGCLSLAFVCGVICIGIIVIGIYAMTQK